MIPIHDMAARGFMANADRYARGRPDYPPALDAWLRGPVRLGHGRTVVDLGAGTGKFVPRVLGTGAAVVAVEPVAAMLARLTRDFPEVRAVAGAADDLPLDDASVDAVVCAQAFHWFATASALREIARVLKPGGVLALVWNVRDESLPSAPWVRRITELANRHEGAAPRFHTGDWRRAFPSAHFGPLDEQVFDHAHVGPVEEVVVERFLSVSFIAALPGAERRAFERRLRALIAAEPALAGPTATMPYRTVAFHCTRRQGDPSGS